MNKKIKPGDTVRFAGSNFKVAEIAMFPHGEMIGIDDEPPSKHIDYLNVSSVKKVVKRAKKKQS